MDCYGSTNRISSHRFHLRLNRELDMEAAGEATWLTLADLLVGISFLILVGGVFGVPLLGTTIATVFVAKLFGLGLVLYAASFFVLAGHYNLYCEWGIRYRFDGKKCPRGA